MKLLMLILSFQFLFSQGFEKIGSYPVGRTHSVILKNNFLYINFGGIIKKLTYPQFEEVKEAIIDGVALQFLIEGDSLFIAASKAGLKILKTDDLNLISSCDTDGTAFRLCFKAPYVYLADGEGGLKIIDVSDQENPKIISSLTTKGYVRDIKLKGKLAFIAEGSAGISVVDISDPRDPKLIANYDTFGYTYAVHIEGNYAFLADGKKLVVLDISDIENIKEINTHKPSEITYLPSFPRVLTEELPHITDITGKKGIVYLTYEGVFLAYDVSEPKNIKEIYKQPLRCINLSLVNDKLIVNGAEYGFWIFDISTPKKPQPVFATPYGRNTTIVADGKFVYINGDCSINKIDVSKYPPKVVKTLPTKDYIQKLHIFKNYLLCANGNEGFKIMDKNLNIISSYKTKAYLFEFDIKFPYVFLAEEKCVEIIDISNPKSPKYISEIKANGIARDVAVSGDAMFVADDGFGVSVVNISNINSPKIVSTYTPPETKTINCVFVKNNILYAGIHGGKLSKYFGYGRNPHGAVDIIDASDLKKLKRFSLYYPYVYHTYYWPKILDVYVEGNICYLACSEGNFVILDISNPSKPELLSQFRTCFPLRLFISSRKAYLANGDNGWDIVDITDPKNPKGIFHIDWKMCGVAKSIFVEGKFAFLSTAGGGIYVIDISKPTKPKLVSKIKTAAGLFTKIKGNYLYTVQATGHGNLYVHDISDIKNPKFIGFWPGYGRPADISISNNRLLIATYRTGIQVLDISDPKSPKRVGQCSTGMGEDAYITKNIACLTHYFGVGVWDISNPTAPVRLGTWKNGKSKDMIARKGRLYCVGGNLFILDITNPKKIKLVSKFDEVYRAYAISLSKKHAFICELFRGISALDISNPRDVKKVGFYPTEGETPWDVFYSGGYVYIADGEAGLTILKLKKEIMKKEKKVRKRICVGGTHYPPKVRVSPKWYYNELIGRAYGYIQASGEYGRRSHTKVFLGVCSERVADNFFPFFAEGVYLTVVGCGINPLQKIPYRGISEGKIISVGGR